MPAYNSIYPKGGAYLWFCITVVFLGECFDENRRIL